MMRNEIKIVEDGVIFELEIEEVEEVVVPGKTGHRLIVSNKPAKGAVTVN